uniref:Putative sok1 kinase belonging to the ste20/sps1/gc kinase family n=1 Tax=Tabanus bromius TaxID=304241 RepID=A0A0K8TRG9_TABBR
MPADSVPRMDSSGSGSEGNNDGALSSSPGTSSLRERTDSEGSDRQTRFVLPSTDGSPPKVLTIDEVVDVVKNIQNMTLVHEIAMNPEFKLQPYEPPENSLERRIRDIMHKAFWDVLRGQLNQDPPCYDHALQLLQDIKECFPQIIPVNNRRLLDYINEVLDTTVVRQQAEEGVLNFRSYADFVISIMAKTCAPVRDDEIKKLSTIEDVVDTFRGILETMKVMKLDMANCLLEFARNDLLANSVEYEKKKFKEHLEYYKFGFPTTEDWLKRNQTHDINGVPCSPNETIYNAYMELLDWNDEKEYPEILSLDAERIKKLSQRAKRLCACASVMAISSGAAIISQRTENRAALAQQVEILFQGVTNESELKEALENVALQVITFINNHMDEENHSCLDETSEKAFKSHILQLANKDSPVRKLMWKRLQIYFRLFLTKKGEIEIPPGYTDFKEELENFATAMKRVATYNFSVFGEYYIEVLTNANNRAASNEPAAATNIPTVQATSSKNNTSESDNPTN